GWSGGLDGLFSASGGNTAGVQAGVGGRLQWRGGPHRLRLQASGGYQESDGVVKERNLVAHLRHNRDLPGRWATVAFAQVQTNPFQRLASRRLLGAGLRLDLAGDGRGTVALGATPMLEIERLSGRPGHTTRGRLSMFLHAARQMGPATRLDAVVFWQPLFADLAAARLVGNLALTVDVAGSVDLKLGAAVEDNADAPAQVERTDWSTYAGVGVGF
ncbi:MAG: DUF481 domain-containing protein, partial [Krumholzibacteria bacterium]|nr:DUF481 domain-containing protein [Candidatus Krumholzibacteria bacterium]